MTNMKHNIKQFAIILSLFTIHYSLFSQTADQLFKAGGSPVNPKVAVSWNRYNDHAGITEICKKIAAAYPDLAKLESIAHRLPQPRSCDFLERLTVNKVTF